MHAWRCLVAVVLVLVGYLLEFGHFWTNAFFCFLCFINLPFKKPERETSTQTDYLIEDTTRQTKKNRVSSSDNHEATGTDQMLLQKYPNVQRSLFQVFKCAYAHLIQPWYSAPELGDTQPLHGALKMEFNLVMERIICKAMNLDLSATSVGCIRIVTHHLHNAKQSDSSPAFRSRFEEIAVLRTFSEALVRNLFPEDLWETKVYKCILTEIMATKLLDMFVTGLCNPDNLNEMVVLKLDRVSKRSIGEPLNSERESTASSTGSEETEVLTDEAEDCQSEETKGKKKGNRIKEKLSKFVDKVKSKKAKKKKLKKKEQEVLQRALSARRSAVIEGDDTSSRDGSIRNHMDSDNDSDLDVYLTSFEEDRMKFKLSYQMWRVGTWAVRVTNVQKENDELCFTVHLEEKNNPENLHWDVRMTQSDILHFHSLWQDTSDFPSISTIVEKSNRELDDKYTEEVRSALEKFLQELVSDAQLTYSQPVFQFLCPLARLLSDEQQEGGVWGLLSGLANFLNPGQDEEESQNLRATNEAGDKHSAEQPVCINTTDEPEDPDLRFCNPHDEMDSQISDETEVFSDGQESLAESLDSFVNRSKLVTPAVHASDASISVNNQTEGQQADTADTRRRSSSGKTKKKEKLTHRRSDSSQKLKAKEKSGQLKEDTTNQPQVQRKEINQSNWEQQEATKAILDLLKEVTGTSFLINIFDAVLKSVMPLVKKRVNNFLKKMNPTEVQIASYIDMVRERVWPDANMPVQPRGIEEKQEMKERALQLINLKYSNSLVLKKADVESVFKIFQDVEENKKLVYMLLSYILRELLPGEPAFSTISDCVIK